MTILAFQAGIPAADGATSLLGDVAIWLGIFVVLIIVLGVSAMAIRRKVNAPSVNSTIGFTLADLRVMHERGELSLEEFERARDRMLGGLKQGGPDGGSGGQATSESRISGRIPPPR